MEQELLEKVKKFEFFLDIIRNYSTKQPCVYNNIEEIETLATALNNLKNKLEPPNP